MFVDTSMAAMVIVLPTFSCEFASCKSEPAPVNEPFAVSETPLLTVTPPSTVIVPFAVVAEPNVFVPELVNITLLKVVAVAAIVWSPAPKTTVPVAGVKRDPVPFQAVPPGEFTWRVLFAPLRVPAVRVISPVNVWVNGVPESRVNVPPEPLMVSPAPETFPVKEATPPVLTIDTSPVVVKPAILWVPDPPILIADPLAVNDPVALIVKFPPNVNA